MSLAIHTSMHIMYEKYDDTSIEISKSYESKVLDILTMRDVNQEPLTFCMWCCACKKHKTDVKGLQSGAPCLLYIALRM
jgi:hypothetical protein